MKVVMTFDFSDDQRAWITTYRRARFGERGLPKLATREMMRDFVHEAVTNQWLAVEDQISIAERYEAEQNDR